VSWEFSFLVTKGAKIDNPEKLGTYGTQNEDKQSKNTTQYVLGWTSLTNKQTNTNNVIKT
jgi:hypothetical protein